MKTIFLVSSQCIATITVQRTANGVLPAIAAGWVISQEDFMKDDDFLTWLKLRGSVGQVGSDQIGSTRFAYISTLIDAAGYGGFGENDVIKALKLLPGIQGGTEGSAGMYVRGGGMDLFFKSCNYKTSDKNKQCKGITDNTD